MRFIAIFALALASLSVAAQDIPGRVGRVSYTDGPVAIYQDPDIGWEKAYVNSPLTSQNSLWTEPGSHAELRVSAVAIRLGGATQMDVSRLDDDEMDASIVRGSVAVRIRHNDYGSRFAFDTPEARFTITREGRYRIDVDPEAQQSRLAVFEGEATMEDGQGTRRIGVGRTVVISNGNIAYDRAHDAEVDRWAQTRDRDWVERQSTQYVSTFMTGYEELDPYGQWIQEPGYGALWVPTQVAGDWVPYRYGHWSYVRPWGWTWIDDQPWGYAPFHYGRWVHVRDRWCWYPGQREARPAWAPALVAWVGGSNWSVSASSGGPVMGWYPLAPTERYQPWYHASDRYVNRVNTIVIRDDRGGRRQEHERGREWNRERAITAVPRENLIDRRPVQSSMVRVTQDAARTVQAVQPQAVAPSNNEIQRMREARSRTAPPSVARQAPSMPQAAPQGQPAARPGANAPIARGERAPAQPQPLPLTAPQVAPGAAVAPAPHPNFGRAARGERPAPSPPQTGAPPMPQAAPAPQAPPAPSIREGRPQPQQQQQAAPPAQGNPLSRGDAGRERAQQEAQQREAQQRQQQEAQRAQQEAQRQQQQQQAQQREAQQRQQQEAQRAQQEAQRQQQQQQAQQREAQQRQLQEAQRAQQEAQRQQQQQQAQQRQQQQEAQRQQQQQQAQQREAQQRQQQEAQRAQQEAQRQQQQQQAQQRPQGNPASRGEEQRAKPHGQNPDNDDKDKGGKR